jgi:hypothetical protein
MSERQAWGKMTWYQKIIIYVSFQEEDTANKSRLGEEAPRTRSWQCLISNILKWARGIGTEKQGRHTYKGGERCSHVGPHTVLYHFDMLLAPL